MKFLLFILVLLPFLAISQIQVDFENSDISSWSQSPESRWAADSDNAISGIISLKHVYDNSISEIDQVSIPINSSLDFSNQTICWQFKLKYAYNPSSGNNWAVYLISD